MSMEPVRNLSARATRARLMNPPGGRESSELEILPQYLARAIKEPPLPIVTTAPPASPEEAAKRDRYAREAAIIEAWSLTKVKNLRSIIMAAKMHFARDEAALFSHRRTVAIVRPRQIMMYLAREHTTLSLPQIGRKLGGFDHTTALHAVMKIKAMLDDGDRAVTHDLAHMENLLGIR